MVGDTVYVTDRATLLMILSCGRFDGSSIFVKNHMNKIEEYEKEGLIRITTDRRVMLTEMGKKILELSESSR